MLEKPEQSALIVDDDATFRYIFCHSIRAAGWRPLEATNSANAIERCREFNPAVIFVDLQMPERDGFETCADLRADPECSKALIVAVSSLPRTFVEDRALRSGFDLYLVKPIGENLLKGILAGATPA